MLAETGTTSLMAIGAAVVGALGALGVQRRRQRNGNGGNGVASLCAVHTATLEKHSEKIGDLRVDVATLDQKVEAGQRNLEQAIQGQTNHLDARLTALASAIKGRE